ncbi:probable glycosyltransferase BC10 [Coccomyxa sp. Obi]|nr:probable glycosyltransferase BC10 [Coccomyxa sp. Obi]
MRKLPLGVLTVLLLGSFPATLSAQRIARQSESSATTALEGGQDTLQSCAALKIPKVAMLFLTVGEIFHEPTWKLWFQEAAGLIPASALNSSDQAQACDDERLQVAQHHCFASEDAGVLSGQVLFSVYVHAQPDFEFSEDSIFHGHMIQNRLQAKRCTQDIVLAERNLLTDALEDPLNQRFILLSETCLPLYPPATLYMQLMSEQKSRLESCHQHRRYPWTAGMLTGHGLRKAWRKGSQWFALIRKHAELVSDHHLLHQFHKHCSCERQTGMHRYTNCYPDEHFMHTVVALEEMGDETDCLGRLTNVDWWRSLNAHPREYEAWELSPDLISYLRYWEETPCEPLAAISSSKEAFVRVGAPDFDAKTACEGSGYNTSLLHSGCPLLARKFPKDLVSTVARIFGTCGFDMKVLDIDGGYGICEVERSGKTEEVKVKLDT